MMFALVVEILFISLVRIVRKKNSSRKERDREEERDKRREKYKEKRNSMYGMLKENCLLRHDGVVGPTVVIFFKKMDELI